MWVDYSSIFILAKCFLLVCNIARSSLGPTSHPDLPSWSRSTLNHTDRIPENSGTMVQKRRKTYHWAIAAGIVPPKTKTTKTKTVKEKPKEKPVKEPSVTDKPKAERSRTGCLTCRQRHMRCDEREPICFNCWRSKRECCRGLKLNFSPKRDMFFTPKPSLDIVTIQRE